MNLYILMSAALVLCAPAAFAQVPEACSRSGPQTPRDIASKAGSNPGAFPLAPEANALNLCNVHFHSNAEHKGPGFSIAAPKEGHGEHGGGGGFACNDPSKLTQAERAPAPGACKGLKPGDTIEVHWVHSSCNVKPGKGLTSCLASDCKAPVLRVESQVFLVVNDSSQLNFANFDYAGSIVNGVHQPKELPSKTGTPVVFRGSTTGPDYDSDQKCSPHKATWSVRPSCAKVDIKSLHKWCEKNAFGEDHGHGVRPLVTSAPLLDKIP